SLFKPKWLDYRGIPEQKRSVNDNVTVAIKLMGEVTLFKFGMQDNTEHILGLSSTRLHAI
ncbi:hypothetical protein PHISCL_10619, partial [Aspergillus sclerotialis]